MTNGFTIPAILTSISFSKDGGLNLRYATNELSAEDKVKISAHHGAFGWLLFRENAIPVSDIPTEQAEDKQKTPSKRQRAVLYLIWEQLGRPMSNFDSYYRDRMENNIQKLKAELEKG